MPETLRRLMHNAPTLLGVLLILLISLSFATQTIDWLQLNRTQVTVQTDEASELSSAPALDSIETLFGPARVAQTTAPPATSLRLTLRGSFVHSDARSSSAIIQRENAKPLRFGVGAEIDKGIRLHAVYRDRVEIERNGRLETLMFNKNKNAPASRPLPSSYDAVDALSTLQQQDEQQLRDRMEALRQQMESAGGQDEPDQEPVNEPEPPAAPRSTEPLPTDPPTESD